MLQPVHENGIVRLKTKAEKKVLQSRFTPSQPRSSLSAVLSRPRGFASLPTRRLPNSFLLYPNFYYFIIL
jgi:hypothetical protein